mmetsp:Transcript_62655/g.149505  ORF Transcript_62655/g.149505 Transcript_62655/m.149505 type:complete len:163 (+) Transcript_62655:188-676(+)
MTVVKLPLPFCAPSFALSGRWLGTSLPSFEVLLGVLLEGVRGRLGDARFEEILKCIWPPSLATSTGVCERALPGGEDVRSTLPTKRPLLEDAEPGRDRSLLRGSPPTALLGRRPWVALVVLFRLGRSLARNAVVAPFWSCHIRGAWWTKSIGSRSHGEIDSG